MSDGFIVPGKTYALTVSFRITEDGCRCEDVVLLDRENLPPELIGGLLRHLGTDMLEGRATEGQAQ